MVRRKPGSLCRHRERGPGLLLLLFVRQPGRDSAQKLAVTVNNFRSVCPRRRASEVWNVFRFLLFRKLGYIFQ